MISKTASPTKKRPFDDIIGNPGLSAVFNRKSVRSYLDKPVEKKYLLELCRAGMSAPSGRDRRDWAFVIITERDILNDFSEQLPYAKMAKNAPSAILVCGDIDKAKTDTPNFYHYWSLDTSAATENILIAAEAMGLGAVWTAIFPYEELVEITRQILNIPMHLIPHAFIPIGWPKGKHVAKDKWDESIIQWNKFPSYE